MSTDESVFLLRVLSYGITTSRNPLDEVEGCIRAVAATDAPLQKYLAAVRDALSCTDPLAEQMLLDRHSETTLRQFLEAVEKRLGEKIAT